MREPLWDGDDLVFVVEDHGRVHVYRVAADGSGEPRLLVGGERVVTGLDVAAGRLVFTASEPARLSELYDGGPAGGQDDPAAAGRRLTAAGDAFAAGRELVRPERFTAVSADGSEVDAWIMRPAGYEQGKKYPTLLNIHGGPYGQYGVGFFDEFQVYCGAGYAVVFSNPRGSSGGTEEWARAIRGPGELGPGWGSVDYEDCMAVVDEAVRRFDFVDADRLGVIGGSYGGYMTSWIVGHTDRFKAAVSERAVNNFDSQWGSSDFGWDFKGYMGTFLYEDVDAYLGVSPVDLRGGHPHAAAHPALGGRPALPRRAGRAPLRDAAPAQAAGRARALPRGVARAHAVRQPACTACSASSSSSSGSTATSRAEAGARAGAGARRAGAAAWPRRARRRGAAADAAARPPARWVRVSVATLWVRPDEARSVDAPACAVPADPRAWLARLTITQKRWLVGRLETQALYGAKVYLLGTSGAWSTGGGGRAADAPATPGLPRLAADAAAHEHGAARDGERTAVRAPADGLALRDGGAGRARARALLRHAPPVLSTTDDGGRGRAARGRLRLAAPRRRRAARDGARLAGAQRRAARGRGAPLPRPPVPVGRHLRLRPRLLRLHARSSTGRSA